jgi:membrane-associated phospholipid phosphatase
MRSRSAIGRLAGGPVLSFLAQGNLLRSTRALSDRPTATLSEFAYMRPTTGKFLGLIVLWILAGCFCLPIDVALSRWFLADGLPGEIRALFHRGEVFGHGYGVLFIAVTIYLLDPGRRRLLAIVVVSFVAAGLTADLLKLQIWRARPYALQELGLGGRSLVGTLWTHLDQWREMGRNAFHSFPSGHTAGAVAFAYGLGRMYPAARRWFYVLATLCALNRVDGGAHFASDVCWGVALGYLTALLVTEPLWRRHAGTTLVREPLDRAGDDRLVPIGTGHCSKAKRQTVEIAPRIDRGCAFLGDATE